MPAHIYRNSAGKRVPGVTTVISGNLGWNKQALMAWANAQGLEGRHHRDVSQAAADIGTIAHAMVEGHLKGKAWQEIVGHATVPPESMEKAENAFNAFIEWKELVNFELLNSEISLVSEQYNFGGTIDVAAIQNKISIVDLKTSNDIYADHRIQIAAYGKLWNENFPDKQVQAYYILRLGKDGSFAYYYWPELDQAWEAFKCLLILHNLKKAV